MSEKKDVVIIGGGPGGYVAALRAAQLQKKVVLIENDRVGGTCMNYGCIPTKYLLHQTKFLQELKKNAQIDGPKAELRLNWKRAQDEKAKVVERLVKGTEFLLEKNGVELILGTGFLKNEREVRVDAAGAERGFEAQAIILATGSRAAHLPFLNPDGREVVTSREALEFTDIPRTMIVIGAGAIGIEIGSIYARMGTEVTILEIMPTILPGCDREIVTRLERLLKKQGLKVHTQMRIEEASVQGGRVVLRGTCLKGNVPFVVEGEKALLATGRRPYSDQFRSAGLPLSLAKGGHIEVDLYLETRIKNIFAVGDLIGGKLLAHKASHEGIIAAENACGGRKTVNYGALPMAVFTEPEFASVGLTEEDAREKLGSIQIGHFSLQASGRALTMESVEGMIKIIAAANDEVIGAHILAPHAGEIIPELTLAIAQKMKLSALSRLIHIHPTISESVAEAALKAKNQALHMLNI